MAGHEGEGPDRRGSVPAKGGGAAETEEIRLSQQADRAREQTALAARSEERAQQRRRLAFPDAADHLRPVVTGSRAEDPRPVLHAAALRVIGAEHQAADPEQAGG